MASVSGNHYSPLAVCRLAQSQWLVKRSLPLNHIRIQLVVKCVLPHGSLDTVNFFQTLQMQL